MKQQIFRAGHSIYGFIKSPLGLTVTGGIAASATTFFFERTKISQDLEKALRDKQKLSDRILNLQNENSSLSRQNRDLALVNSGYVIKSDELRDELRRAAAEYIFVKEQLNHCNRTVAAFESELKNKIWFFSGNNVYNKHDATAKMDDNTAAASLLKK